MERSEPQTSPLFRTFRWLMYYCVAVPILYVVNRLYFGFRVEERDETGTIPNAIVLCNHIHPLDATMVACGMPRHRLNIAVMNRNMESPIAGKIVTLFGTPVGAGIGGHKKFVEHAVGRLIRGEWFLIFPEGELILYDKAIRPFKNGAFLLSYKANVPVLPAVLVQRPASGLRAILRKKPLLSLKIGAPLWPVPQMDEKQNIEYLRDTALAVMTNLLRCGSPNGMTEFSEQLQEPVSDHQ